jgi:anti-sigma B factor antagonist
MGNHQGNFDISLKDVAPVESTGPKSPPKTVTDSERPSSGPSLIRVLKITGRLSLETVHKFLHEVRSETALFLIVDLSGVAYLDSAGVGALIDLSVSRRAEGKKVAFVALTPQSLAAIEVSGLLNVLPIYSSLDFASLQLNHTERP